MLMTSMRMHLNHVTCKKHTVGPYPNFVTKQIDFA